MKWIKRFFYFIGTLYLLGCIILYFNQERIIFLPTELPSNYSFRAGEEVFIELEDELKLNALWLRTPNSKGVIIYWHGNRGSNRRCLRQADNLAGLGYDVLMPDYRGYGKSEGEIFSEKQLVEDAQKVYDYVTKQYKEEQMILLGYSLGSGVATHLAKENKPQQLFLVAPYKSMVAMKNIMAPFVPSFLMKYHFRTDKLIKDVDCPITLLHGTEDELIPYAHSEYFYNQQPDKIQLIPLQGISHRGAIFSDLLRRKLGQALR